MRDAPKRIRLSRRKGWRLPEGAVTVARPGKWGNPFVVGVDGTRAECVSLFAMLAGGFIALSTKVGIEPQQALQATIAAHLDTLCGRDLACWCALDGPCHADVLIALANEPRRKGMLDRFLASAGAH